MKKVVMSVLLIALVAPLAVAETTQKTLAATMDVIVFPTDGQDYSQQSKDEAECYTWAVQNTGADPFELQAKNEQVQK